LDSSGESLSIRVLLKKYHTPEPAGKRLPTIDNIKYVP
jgi:hypothetical protein